MKVPPSAYQKLFDSTIAIEFPQIDYIWVNKNWVIDMLEVYVHLKPASEQEGMISANYLLRNIGKRISELGGYLGGTGECSLYIIFEKQVLAKEIFSL